ncbi:MAG: glycosyltransferase [Okeania sp. SIO2G4]|uniref:glycosyltransferase n=1 Tax=unclassified Okeania TaxID=2634635 RepID=UPI0013BD08E5|nr:MULTISPECIES: glycosyltransferase [unclassified Okeania]NEP72057.1 glycosyltransferase [Okeania sp. SIO2G5]NEP92913.1 glycosyltransferase [Okeania sp. SIO2F5]NEQ94110.1 glycosyltransferase [Okeania sp. SIO2G4]
MKAQQVNHLAEIRYRLAKGWQIKGKIETAISGYKEVINMNSNYIPAYLSLGDLLLAKGDWQQAQLIYDQAVKINPNFDRLHKNLVNVIAKYQGIDEAFNYYQLTRQDQRKITINTTDILACVVVRNESLRLPYFLSYHRQQGIDKFLIVDNGSNDETLAYLLQQPDVYLWQSFLSFNQANFGSAWFEVLLRKYALDHWCLMVDADELFYYPNCESKKINQLCEELEQQGKKALNTVLLDMYSDKAIAETHYQKGENFLEVCPYFDRQFYHTKKEKAGPYQNHIGYFGGVRQRVFGEQGAYYLTKVPLIKYDLNLVLTGGQHYTNCPEDKIAGEWGCLLHFKYFSSFSGYVKDQVERKEHYNQGMQYLEYAKGIDKNHNLTLYNPKYSLQFKNSQQLLDLGIMKIQERAVFSELKDDFISHPDSILLYTDCPEIYGAAQWNHALICALAEAGYHINCAQSKASHHLVTHRKQLGIQHLWLEEDNIYHSTQPARAFVNTTEAANILAKTKPKLIIFSDGCPVSNLAAKQVAIEQKIPFIIINHCVSDDWAKLFSPYLDHLPNIYQQAKTVIAVSQANLNLLHQLFNLPKNKGEVIYNGRPKEFFTQANLVTRNYLRQSLNIPQNAIVCFTAARLEVMKGYQYQLSAMEILKQKEIWSKLYFVWAGSGSLEKKIMPKIKELGIENKIKLIGDRSDIPDLLDMADIFILPSQFEGMPLSIMEAMAKGKPVIATAVSGIPEELGDTGKLLSDPKINAQATIKELAETIENWANNFTLATQIGLECKQRAEQMFQQETMIKYYLDLIDKAI